MAFSANSSFLYGIAVLVIIFVLAQSVFFLVRAYRRGVEMGMAKEKLRRVMISSAVFTVAPAVSILLGVVTLSKFLGIPLPWIRMSVIGALTYELPAASSTAKALGVSLSEMVTDPKVYTAIAWVMTLGIMPSILLPPVLMKKIRGGVVKLRSRDEKWGDLFMTSMFLGMISAFLGMVFADVGKGAAGLIPILVLLCSAALMGVCGLLIKKKNMQWLETYAMSISMIGAMVFAVVIAPLLS
ncbi:MAG: DUF5058 family protein [Clostridia bacterium]|nr:DUF5058 family protein [Clostridia bacterium]